MYLNSLIPKRKLPRLLIAIVTVVVSFQLFTMRFAGIVSNHGKHRHTNTGIDPLPSEPFLHKRSEEFGRRELLQNNQSSSVRDETRITEEMGEKLLSYNKTEFWIKISKLVSEHELYPKSLNVQFVTSRLVSSKIVYVQNVNGGTSYKWMIFLEGGQVAVFKPQLLRPGFEEKPFCNMGHEQPQYEVAAFHLYRLFGLRSVPFVAGRTIDIFSEILPYASPEVKASIKTGNDKDACIHHKCYYCKTEGTFCFPKGLVRGAVIFWMWQMVHYELGAVTAYHPFHPLSGNFSFQTLGVNDKRHCDFVRSLHLYNEEKYFLDLVDMAVMNYVLGNEDEKHTYLLDDKMNPLVTLHIDHGLAFCEKGQAGRLMLAPLYQCCRIRDRTVSGLRNSLRTLKRNFKQMSSGDPLYPLLRDSQLDNIIGRIKTVLETVADCQRVLPDSEIFDKDQ